VQHGQVTARAILIAIVLALCPLRGALAAEAASCESAGAAAEREWELPPGLLASIGHIESGRYDPLTGRIAAWPWTINAASQGRYFDSGAAAAAAVRDLLIQGVRLIDVGCFQIDLLYHPDAFATLEEAFDPHSNAAYAARFLAELHARTGSWEAAIASYHSAMPAEGGAYRSRVMADWQSGGLRIAPAMPGLRALRAGAGDRFSVLVSAAALALRVVTPEVFSRPPAAIATTTVAAADRFAPVHRGGGPARLPRIITPRG
jgi:hypothetical protein